MKPARRSPERSSRRAPQRGTRAGHVLLLPRAADSAEVGPAFEELRRAARAVLGARTIEEAEDTLKDRTTRIIACVELITRHLLVTFEPDALREAAISVRTRSSARMAESAAVHVAQARRATDTYMADLMRALDSGQIDAELAATPPPSAARQAALGAIIELFEAGLVAARSKRVLNGLTERYEEAAYRVYREVQSLVAGAPAQRKKRAGRREQASPLASFSLLQLAKSTHRAA